MGITPEVQEILKGYTQVNRWARRMGFRNRKELVQCLRAASLGDVGAGAMLDERWPEWRNLPRPTSVPDGDELSTDCHIYTSNIRQKDTFRGVVAVPDFLTAQNARD